MHISDWPQGRRFRVTVYLLPVCLLALAASLATNNGAHAQDVAGACTGECGLADGCGSGANGGCGCKACGYADSGRGQNGCGLAKCGCALGLGCKSGDCGDGTHCGLPAPSYPVPFATPRPTTPTHFTYPPMMPHNSLPHYRSTYSFRHGPGLSRTEVHWRPKKLVNVADYLHHLIEIPR